MLRRRHLAPLVLAFALIPAAPAGADTESWNWLEVRLPLSDGSYGLPQSLRLFTDLRYAGRAGGLYQTFFRVGPLWDLHPNLFLATHVTSAANRSGTGAFEQEHRLELEPNLRARFGALAVNDRNRLEYRWGTAGPRWRYRNQVWLNYAPAGASWIPFVWDEILFDLAGTSVTGFTQNRASVGLGRMLSDATRLNLGYVLRSRMTSASAWEHDHVALVNLAFAPSVPPLMRAEGMLDEGFGE